MNQGGGGGFAA